MSTPRCIVKIAGEHALSLRDVGAIIGRNRNIEATFDLVAAVAAARIVANVALLRSIAVLPEVAPELGLAEMVAAAEPPFT
jgi:hypothetical protein